MAGTSKKFNVYYHHDGKAVKSATVALERKSGSKWVRVSNVKVAKGKGSVTVKPTVTTTYRFHKPGAVISSTHKVTVKPPSSFTITGSGSGHGVGLSQYGAYEMALQGKSYTDILTHYFTGTAVPSVTTPDRIKVQVFGPEAYPNSYAPGRYSDTATSTSVSFTGSWKVGTGEGGMVSSLTGTAAQHLAISVSGSGDKRIIALRLMVGKVATRTVTADSSTAFTISWTSGYATVAGAQGTYNNGTLVVTAIGAQPNVVNDVALNTEYLYGISEMPSSWGTASSGRGLNALEAQAVVARTYALNKAKTLNTKCNCNLVDDVRDQNYTGWKKQNETVGSTDYGQFWVKAVNATTTNSTTARAITSGGTLISSAPYFAASGGHTANNADVWQGASAGPQLSYLHSVSSPDLAAPKNPYAKWTDSISQATAMKIFAYSSTKLANIRSITVSDRYVTDTTKRDGQVRTLTATSDTGVKASVSASPEWWRSTLGVYAAWISSFTPKK
jgi:stage II sporulation protein D